MDEHGGKVTLGRVFGVLLAQTEPISLSDLAKKCHISKPAMSNNVAAATALQLAQKVHKKESPREDFYECRSSFVISIFEAGLYKMNSMAEFFVKALEIMKIDEPDLLLADKEAVEKYLALKKNLEFYVKAFNLMKDDITEFYEKLTKKLELLYR